LTVTDASIGGFSAGQRGRSTLHCFPPRSAAWRRFDPSSSPSASQLGRKSWVAITLEIALFCRGFRAGEFEGSGLLALKRLENGFFSRPFVPGQTVSSSILQPRRQLAAWPNACRPPHGGRPLDAVWLADVAMRAAKQPSLRMEENPKAARAAIQSPTPTSGRLK
jgi:hypothetical protein